MATRLHIVFYMRSIFSIIISLILTSCSSFQDLQISDKADPDAPEILLSNDLNKKLTFKFIDVGQGDSTLIYASPNDAILIDAGPPEAGKNKVLPILMENHINNLRYIIATHYHSDHIGGIPEVIRGPDDIAGTSDDIIPTKGVLDRGGDYEGSVYDAYQESTKDYRITVYPGYSFNIGTASVEVVAANTQVVNSEQTYEDLNVDENSLSIVLLVEQDGFRYLHASDITGGGGDPPYQTLDLETPIAEYVGDIDVLRVAHHGSKTSSNKDFIDITDPEIAIISLGDDNDYGHPDTDVIESFLDNDTELYLTEAGWMDDEFYLDDAVNVENGTISISVLDGDLTIE